MATATPTAPTARTARLLLAGSPGHRLVQAGILVVAALVVTYIATSLEDYRILMFSRVLVYSMTLLGFCIVAGYSGQLSLGQGAFFGVGAYTTAILVTDHSWPFLLTLPVSVVIGMLGGLAVGLPALRVRGFYLALITLTLAVVFPVLLRKYDSLTGGSPGKPVDMDWEAPPFIQAAVTDVGWRFIVISIATALVLLVGRNIVVSRIGRALLATRDSETAAAVAGVHLARFKTQAFVVSAGMASFSGSMFCLVVRNVSPESFGLHFTIELVAGLVIGGMATIGGGLVGALVMVWLPYYTAQWSTHLSFLGYSRGSTLANAIYGVVLIVIIYALPGGVASGIRSLTERFVRVVPLLPAASGDGPGTGTGAGGPVDGGEPAESTGVAAAPGERSEVAAR